MSTNSSSYLKRTITLVAFVCIFFSFINAQSSPERKQQADDIIKRNENSKRYIYFTNNMKMQEYPSVFCGGKDVYHCDTSHYVESVMLTAGIGFLVGIIGLLAGILFWTLRACCFGGCYPSFGLFIPGSRFSGGQGYTSKQIWAVKIGLLVTLFCSIPFFVVGLVGNHEFTSALNDFSGNVISGAHKILSSLQYIDTRLIELGNNPNSTSYQRDIQVALSAAITDGNALLERGEQLRDVANNYNTIRERIILAGLILPVLLLVVSTAAALFNLAKLTLFTSIFGFLVLCYGWFAFSGHYPISLVASDICYTIDNGGLSSLLSTGNSTNPNSTTSDIVLNSLIECGSNNSSNPNPFQPILDIAQSGLATAYAKACNGFGQICNVSYSCPTDSSYTQFNSCKVLDCPSVPCNSTTIPLYRKSTVNDFSLGCLMNPGKYPPVVICPYDAKTQGAECPGTVIACNSTPLPFNDCPQKCRLPQARNATQQIVTGLNMLEGYNDVLVNYIFPLLECSFFGSVLAGVKDAMCVTLVDSVTFISVGEAGLSSILIPGIILSILGIKRFHSGNRKNKEKWEYEL